MRLVANIFEPKATRVVRCLLVNIGKGWTVREMADEANTSVGYTHAVLASLISMGYARKDERNKVVLLDPEILLRRWAAFYQYDRSNSFIEYYTFEQQIDTFLIVLKEKLEDEEYALTSLAGAWLVSPYVRPIDVHFYVKNREEGEHIAKILDIRPTAGVGNVRLVIPYDVGVFHGTRLIEGVKVVSNVQLFVDLWNYAARGEDAAVRLHEIMEKDWGRILTGDSHVR